MKSNKIFLMLVLFLLALAVFAEEADWSDPQSLSTSDLVGNPSKAKEVWGDLTNSQKESVFKENLKDFSDKFASEKGLSSLKGSLDNCKYDGTSLSNGNIKVNVNELKACNVEALSGGGFKISKNAEFTLSGNRYNGEMTMNNDGSVTLSKNAYMVYGDKKITAESNKVNVYLDKEASLIKGKTFAEGNVYIKDNQVILQGNGIKLEYNSLTEQTISNNAQTKIVYNKATNLFNIEKFAGDSITDLGKVMMFKDGKIEFLRKSVIESNKANALINYGDKKVVMYEKGSVIISRKGSDYIVEIKEIGNVKRALIKASGKLNELVDKKNNLVNKFSWVSEAEAGEMTKGGTLKEDVKGLIMPGKSWRTGIINKKQVDYYIDPNGGEIIVNKLDISKLDLITGSLNKQIKGLGIKYGLPSSELNSYSSLVSKWTEFYITPEGTAYSKQDVGTPQQGWEYHNLQDSAVEIKRNSDGTGYIQLYYYSGKDSSKIFNDNYYTKVEGASIITSKGVTDALFKETKLSDGGSLAKVLKIR